MLYQLSYTRAVVHYQRVAARSCVVGAAGLEPATSCSQSRRASQTAPRPVQRPRDLYKYTQPVSGRQPLPYCRLSPPHGECDLNKPIPGREAHQCEPPRYSSLP